MAKPKENVERKFYLDSPKGVVEVTVKGPAGAVRLSSTESAISISTSSSPAAQLISQAPGALIPATNRELSVEGERMLESLKKQNFETHKKAQSVTAGDKQKALLENIGAETLIEELQELAVPDA